MTRARLNLWLTILGIIAWAIQPIAVDPARIDPPLADTIYQEVTHD